MSRPVTVFLCGDVMTGRGVDQILPTPGDPRLWEPFVHDARNYIALAEAANGLIPRPVDFAWPWGDALRVLAEMAPDVRILNLETSITRVGQPARASRSTIGWLHRTCPAWPRPGPTCACWPTTTSSISATAD